MEAPARTRLAAKRLRRTMSLPEVLLWRAIKGRQVDGLQFRRQHPIGPYILDFYCDAAKLCVEVDSYVHGTAARPARDERRDAWLAAREIRTLRIQASLILDEVDDAVRTIRAALEP